MSCDTGLLDTDPASLRTSLVRRVPKMAGVANDLLRESATEFFRRSGVWRDQRMTLVCNTVSTRYSLPAPSPGRIVRLAHVWIPSSTGEYKMWHDTEIRSEPDGRQKWHQPSPSSVSFHKPFEADVTLRLESILTIGDDNVGDASLIEEYREGIIAGAIHYGAMSLDKETSDRMAGIDYHELFQQAIKDASSVYQRKFGPERQSMSRMKAMIEGR